MKNKKETIKVNPYTLMSIEFEGFPKVEEIKPLVRMIFVKYKLKETNEALTNFVTLLIHLKKSQAVSEMSILRHIVQFGDSTLELKKEAVITAVYLARYAK